MDVINVVASGDLGREFDLKALESGLSDFPIELEYNPETFPGLIIRSESESLVVIVYSTGSFVIMGANSEKQAINAYELLLDFLIRLGITFESKEPTISNLICKDSLDQEVDLNILSAKLGFENTEYEPETSPFLYYWPTEFDCLLTIPTNGEVIVTGVTDIEVAKRAISKVQAIIDDT